MGEAKMAERNTVRTRVVLTFTSHALDVGPLFKDPDSHEKRLGLMVGEIHLRAGVKFVAIQDAGNHEELKKYTADNRMVLTHVGNKQVHCKQDYFDAVNTYDVGAHIRLKFIDLRTHKRPELAAGEEPDAKRSRIDKANAGLTGDIHEEKLAKQEAEPAKAEGDADAKAD